MTKTVAPGSQTAAHHAVHNPYAQQWAEAAARIASLIAQVQGIDATLDAARANLNWQGGSERYFEWQATRQHHYLQGSNNDLAQLRAWMARAAQAGATVKWNPLAGAVS